MTHNCLQQLLMEKQNWEALVLQVGQNNYTEFWSLNFMEHLKLPLIFKNWATKVASAEKREFQISGLKHEDESFKRWIVNLTTCIFM